MSRCVYRFDLAIIDNISREIYIIQQNSVSKKDGEMFGKCYIDAVEVMKNSDKYVTQQNSRYIIIYDKDTICKYNLSHTMGVTSIDDIVQLVDNDKLLYNLLYKICKRKKNILNTDFKDFMLNQYINVMFILNIVIVIFMFILDSKLNNINNVIDNSYNQEMIDKISEMDEDIKLMKMNIKSDMENLVSLKNVTIDNGDKLNKLIKTFVTSYNSLDKRLSELDNKVNYIILQNVKKEERDKKQSTKDKDIFKKYNKILDELEKELD